MKLGNVISPIILYVARISQTDPDAVKGWPYFLSFSFFNALQMLAKKFCPITLEQE